MKKPHMRNSRKRETSWVPGDFMELLYSFYVELKSLYALVTIILHSQLHVAKLNSVISQLFLFQVSIPKYL